MADLAIELDQPDISTVIDNPADIAGHISNNNPENNPADNPGDNPEDIRRKKKEATVIFSIILGLVLTIPIVCYSAFFISMGINTGNQVLLYLGISIAIVGGIFIIIMMICAVSQYSS